MPKTPDKRNDVQFTIKIPMEDAAFLEAYRVRKKLPSITDVFREMIGALRTNFGLPPFLHDRITQDMEERDLTILQYAQDVLGRYGTQLLREDETRPPEKRAVKKS